MEKKSALIGCVILASGVSNRFGNENKLLIPFNGKPLIEYILETISTSSFVERVCVSQRTEIDKATKLYNIKSVMHNMCEKKDTVRIGIDFLLAKGSLDGIMFCVADQPYLTLQTIERLCDDFRKHPNNIVRVASYDNKGSLFAGNPVIFPASLFEELRTLKGNENGRNVILNHSNLVRLIPIQDRLELMDIDTPKELVRLVQDNNKLLIN